MTDDDKVLVARIRPLLQHRSGITEQKMFGGVAFMLNGNMCIGPWKGSLIVRLDRDDHDKTLAEPHVQPMDITGKIMRGWARIEPSGIKTEKQLRHWIERSLDYVKTLLAKEKKPKKQTVRKSKKSSKG